MVWGHPEGRQAPPLTLGRGYCVHPREQEGRGAPHFQPRGPLPCLPVPSLPKSQRGDGWQDTGPGRPPRGPSSPERVAPMQGPSLYIPSKTGTGLKGQQWSPSSWPHVPRAVDTRGLSCASEWDSPHPAVPPIISKIPSALRSQPPSAGHLGAEVTGLKAASLYGGCVGHCRTQACPMPG